MKAFRTAALGVFVALASSPEWLFAQNGSLAGKVFVAAGGKPVASAEVLVPSLSLSTRSDSVGQYHLPVVPPGTYEVTVRSMGYEALTAKIEFAASKEVRANFQLTATGPILETVTVNGTLEPRWAQRLVEFDQRRQTGVGVFLTYDKLMKNSSMSVSAIFTSLIPGVRIAKIGGSDVAISSRGGRNCPLQILMNRLNMFNGESHYFDVNSIEANEILGVEYYNAFSTPSELNSRPRGPYGGSRCGTLVIWMK